MEGAITKVHGPFLDERRKGPSRGFRRYRWRKKRQQLSFTQVSAWSLPPGWRWSCPSPGPGTPKGCCAPQQKCYLGPWSICNPSPRLHICHYHPLRVGQGSPLALRRLRVEPPAAVGRRPPAPGCGISYRTYIWTKSRPFGPTLRECPGSPRRRNSP